MAQGSFESLFEDLMTDCQERLHHNRCLEVTDLSLPNLRNQILPMFGLERWLSGPGQISADFYVRLTPALRLASRLLMEDCILSWFCRLTFGKRRADKSVRPAREYLSPTKFQQTPEAFAEVRDKLRSLGEVITFMFAPRRYPLEHYGETYPTKEATSFFHAIRTLDWPRSNIQHLSKRHPQRLHPCVVLQRDFGRYLTSQNFDNSTGSLWYRTQFLFTITLLHEVAHAYSFWLFGEAPEPCWDERDDVAELGYSWEQETFGRIMKPLWNEILGCSVLLAFDLKPYSSQGERKRVLKGLIGSANLHWKRVDRYSDRSPWEELLDRQWYHGSGTWFCGHASKANHNFIATLHAIPVTWIASWFTEA